MFCVVMKCVGVVVLIIIVGDGGYGRGLLWLVVLVMVCFGMF